MKLDIEDYAVLARIINASVAANQPLPEKPRQRQPNQEFIDKVRNKRLDFNKQYRDVFKDKESFAKFFGIPLQTMQGL